MPTAPDLLSEYEGRCGKGVSREEIIACAERIPPLPQNAIKLLKLLDDPDSNSSQLAKVVSLDTGIASAVLRIANSAAFAQAGRVVAVEQAVTLVRYAKMRSLVLATSMRGMAKREPVDTLVWENSLATAMIGRRLAETVARPLVDEIFLTGLLHRLGQVVLLSQEKTRAAYLRVLERIRETGVDFVTAEMEEIGFSHPLIGALVASRWNFPPEICQTILHYREPLEGIETPADRKLSLVKMADLLAHASGLGHPEGHPVDLETIEKLGRSLGLIRTSSEEVPGLIGQAQEQFATEASLWAA